MNTNDLQEGTVMCDCGHMESPHSSVTRGYATDLTGKVICWDCATKIELEYMRQNGKNTLYLVKRDNKYHVTDWTGKVDFVVKEYSTSRHNIGRVRIDVWFTFEGKTWHGYQIGDYNEVCHCQVTKK